MKLTFLDPVFWDYDADTPLEHGLGGSQSAACSLAVELARRGHDVTFVNATPVPHFCQGVYFTGVDRLFRPDEVLIVLNGAIGTKLRSSGIKSPMVLWSQHDADQPPIADLHDAAERSAWSRIVLVSQWQATRYAAAFGIEDAEIIGNPLALPFLEEPIREPWFKTGEAPVLTYTSTPYRGLQELLDSFPAIRDAIPDVRLNVFSDMRLYHSREDQWQHLYARARDIEQLEFFGSVGQRRLAGELAASAAQAYPCTFPETFCNAAVEAASMGATPIVPRLGALPEVLVRRRLTRTSRPLPAP